MQAGFIVVDKDAGGDVHGVAEDEALGDATFLEAMLNLRRDIDKFSPGFSAEPEFFSITFHDLVLSLR
jgi:hypothetical protein